MRKVFFLFLMMLALLLPSTAQAVQIRDVIRIKGSEHNKLVGMGLVVGLNGTGDGGNFSPSLQMLAQMVGRFGDPNVDANQLRDTKNIALVYLVADLPPHGVAEGDRVDVTVAVAGPASSLAGGTLMLIPMTGPLPNSPVMAFAEGKISIPDAKSPAMGTVVQGAQLTRDVMTRAMDAHFRLRLIIDESYAGWPTANAIVGQINGVMSPDGPDIAKAVDGKNILIHVPMSQRDNPAQFINDILVTYIDMSFISGGAKVVVNERSGTIVITGNVEVSPVLISHAGLTVTTLTPDPIATPFEPIETQTHFIAMDPEQRGGAKLADLLEAFNQLKVSAKDRIEMLRMMHQAGQLHAEFIVE